MEQTGWKEAARGRLRPVVLTLDRWGFSPLTVTLIGLGICLVGAWLVAEGLLLWGTVIFLFGSAFDMLDGALARLQNTVSRRGAFLDSALDRFGEAAYLIGVAIWWMEGQPENWQRAVILVLVTLFGSLATSYVRARAEGLGETCYVGVLQRTERILLLGLGGLLGRHVLYGVLWVLAILTLVTTVHRIVHVAGKLPGSGPVDRLHRGRAGREQDAQGIETTAADAEAPAGDAPADGPSAAPGADATGTGEPGERP
jgi:CDP-diacylglycerol---glycerol-3-phosphate 3-phosphatidyltransferase